MALQDAAILAVILGLARVLGRSPESVWTGHTIPSAVGIAATLVGLGVCGLYSPHHLIQGWSQASRVFRAWVLVASFTLAVAVMSRGGPLGLQPLLILSLGFLVMGVVRIGVVRPWFLRRFAASLRGARVIVGTGQLARRMAEAADQGDESDPRLVGFVDDLDETASLSGRGPTGLSAPYLGGTDRIREMAREHRISHVLVAREDLSRGRLVELAHAWMEHGLKVSLVSSAFEVMVARASASMLGGVPLAILQPSPQRGWRLKGKRIIDIGLVAIGGIVILPLLAAIAVAIKFTSPGPVLYKQQRVGRNGREFTLFKFRSMQADNDDRPHREYVEALIRGEPAAVNVGGEKVYKLVNDPRVTPLGRFLRATSLDEFPQLWNVFRGDMSLVGPRPCLPYEWDLYEDWQRARLNVLPGITGLWQVSGRSQVPFEEMVLLDLHYIANWSLGLDMALLFKTLPVVLNGSGGH
jgi:exopolysaccharide biosynthesis polyprenyl glycosylphosphotransferase